MMAILRWGGIIAVLFLAWPLYGLTRQDHVYPYLSCRQALRQYDAVINSNGVHVYPASAEHGLDWCLRSISLRERLLIMNGR